MAQVKFPHGFRGDDRLNQIFDDRMRLPGMLRRLHVWQTGVPDPRQAPRPSSPFSQLGRDLALLGGFMTFTGFSTILALRDPVSLTGMAVAISALYGSFGITGRLRRFVVGHTHEAAHGAIAAFYNNNGHDEDKAWRLNEIVLDFGSALTLTKNGLDYRRAHKRHHNELDLGTLRDPDGMDLHAWGLWPGLGSPSLTVDILATVFDPVWHCGILLSRLKSNFAKGTIQRRLAATLVLAALAASAAILPFPVWLMTIGLPWTAGYHIAALLQVLTEHPYGFAGGAPDLARHAERNWERIPIDPMPKRGPRSWRSSLAWTRWLARLVLYHVPSRLAVLDSSMIAHGWHHLAWPLGQPFADWWHTNSRMVSARFRGSLPKDAATRIVWGLPEALDVQARRFKNRRHSRRDKQA